MTMETRTSTSTFDGFKSGNPVTLVTRVPVSISISTDQGWLDDYFATKCMLAEWATYSLQNKNVSVEILHDSSVSMGVSPSTAPFHFHGCFHAKAMYHTSTLTEPRNSLWERHSDQQPVAICIALHWISTRMEISWTSLAHV